MGNKKGDMQSKVISNELDQAPKTGNNYQKRLHELSPEIDKAFEIQENFEKDVTRFMERGHLDYLNNNPKVQRFLQTDKGKSLMKEFGYLQDEYASLTTHIGSSPDKKARLTSLLKKAAIYLTTLLSLGGAVSCSTSEDKENIPEIIKNNDIGTYSEAIDHITIVSDNDAEKEKEFYRSALLAFKGIEGTLKKLFPDENMTFHRFLPLMIKESRLNAQAKSTSGATGYFQIKDPAINDVNKFLKEQNIEIHGYSPKTNPSHNILYGVIYFMMTHDQFKEKYPDIQDIDKFVYASYNAGLSRMYALIDESKCKSRDEFVDYITDLMDISKSPSKKTSAYGIDIENIFDKDYSKDQTVIFDEGGPTLTKKKAQEIINYVENIASISRTLDNSRSTLRVYSIVEIPEGETLFKTIMQMKKDGRLKIKDGTNMLQFCKDIATDNSMNPDNIPAGATLVITQQIMTDFDYLDKNIYEYTTVSYDKENNYYLGKIVEKTLSNTTFQTNVIKKIPKLQSEEYQEDVEFYIMNAIIAFNTDNRKGRSTTTSENVWIPTDPKYYINHMEAKDKEVDAISNIDQKITIASTYIDPSIDKIGETVINEGIFTKEAALKFEKDFKKITGSKQTLNKDKLSNPQFIILHSTASGENTYTNAESIKGIKAHFFISRNGTIYMLTDSKGGIRQINHAGFGLKGQGAIRGGDSRITYKSIGIEVDSKPGEKRNQSQYDAVKKLINYLGAKYSIKKKNVLTHSQVAFSENGRGRKQDPYYVNRSKLGLPDNYDEIDKDVARGKSPNTTQFIEELRKRGLTKQEIKHFLSGIDAGISIAKTKNVKRMSSGDTGARKTAEDIL